MCKLEMNTWKVKLVKPYSVFIGVPDSSLPLRGLAGRDHANFHLDSP